MSDNQLIKQELILALSSYDSMKASKLLKQIHSQGGTLDLTLAQSPLISLGPAPISRSTNMCNSTLFRNYYR